MPDPNDAPAYWTPWPPYVPLPNGRWPELSPAGAKLCVGPGWFPLIDRAFAHVLPLRVYELKIAGLKHYRGALVLTAGATHGDELALSPIARYALDGLEREFEMLAYESTTMCEICGAEVERGSFNDKRIVCIDHALALANGSDERLLWADHGWVPPVALAHPPTQRDLRDLLGASEVPDEQFENLELFSEDSEQAGEDESPP